MQAQAENKSKLYALLFTVVFHVLLFLAFIWIVFVTPIPPFEKPEIIELEIGLGMEGFGENAGGSGQNEPEITTSPEASTSSEVNNNDAPNIITDNSENVAVVKSNPNNTSKVEEAKTEQPSSELQKALDALKSKKNKNGKGEGTGNTGGSGTGTGTGIGDGNNEQEGNNPDGGISGSGGYDLKGWIMVKKPDQMRDAEEEGVVVVQITVDETGKVIKAVPGQRGSTTTSAKLYAKARLAALQTKFSLKSGTDASQAHKQGTLTFIFQLE